MVYVSRTREQHSCMFEKFYILKQGGFLFNEIQQKHKTSSIALNDGIWPGRVSGASEVLVGAKDGVLRTFAVRRQIGGGNGEK